MPRSKNACMIGSPKSYKDKLSATKFEDFNDLVNIAIRAEHKMKNLEAKNKRPAPTSAGLHLLLHPVRRVLNLHVLCGLCATLNLLKDKLLDRPMPIGATHVLPQRVRATIVVA